MAVSTLPPSKEIEKPLLELKCHPLFRPKFRKVKRRFVVETP